MGETLWTRCLWVSSGERSKSLMTQMFLSCLTSLPDINYSIIIINAHSFKNEFLTENRLLIKFCQFTPLRINNIYAMRKGHRRTHSAYFDSAHDAPLHPHNTNHDSISSLVRLSELNAPHKIVHVEKLQPNLNPYFSFGNDTIRQLNSPSCQKTPPPPQWESLLCIPQTKEEGERRKEKVGKCQQAKPGINRYGGRGMGRQKKSYWEIYRSRMELMGRKKGLLQK